MRKLRGTGGSGFVVPIMLLSDAGSGVTVSRIGQGEGSASNRVIAAWSTIWAFPGSIGGGRTSLSGTR